MAKKKSRTQAPAAAKQPPPRLSVEALLSASDSDDGDDDELPPESEWDARARALRAAIEGGGLDEAVRRANANRDGGDDDFEEATLDDESDDESSTSNSGASEHEGDDEQQQQQQEPASLEEEKKVAEDKEGEEEDSSEASEQEEKGDNEEKRDDSAAVVKAKALRVVTASLMAEKKPWAETFAIVPPTPLPFGKGEPAAAVSIHDDLKREVAFYDSALEAVLEAKERCQQAGIPFTRPDDFFAEMVKTDEHMAKVKDRLIFETKKMDAVAQRKSNREHKLRARESHAHKLAEKAQRKKDHLRAVQDWAESAARNRGGRLSDDRDDVDAHFPGSNSSKGSGGGANNSSKKRQRAEQKYGFGGKRGRFKQADPKALNDLSGYNRNGNFAGRGTKKTGKGGGGSGGANRKGKRARDASRSR